MRTTASQTRFFKLTAALLLLALLLVMLVQLTDRRLREQREDAVYDTVLSAAAAAELSPALVLAVIRTESDFDPNALSPVGAVGLMQLMPETFAFLRDEKLCEDLPDNAVWEPQVNIRYGSYYLAYLLERFGDLNTALAAYNAGEGRVSEWLSDPALSQNGQLKRIPFPETDHYVAVTLEAYRNYIKKYNFKE